METREEGSLTFRYTGRMNDIIRTGYIGTRRDAVSYASAADKLCDLLVLERADATKRGLEVDFVLMSPKTAALYNKMYYGIDGWFRAGATPIDSRTSTGIDGRTRVLYSVAVEEGYVVFVLKEKS